MKHARDVVHRRAPRDKKKVYDLQKFYRSCPWDKWWDDFLTNRDRKGELIYSTAWSFCKAMGNDRREQQVIYWCIGPKPTLITKSGKIGEMPVKWLGDWQQLRNETFIYSDKKVQTLKAVLDERLSALDAARGVATVALDWVARAETYSAQINDYFKGAMMPPVGTPLKIARQRANTFLDLQKSVMDMQMGALHEYLRCLGIGEDDVSVLAQMAAVGAQATLKGVAAGSEAVQNTLKNTTLGLMMETFIQKSEIYGLGLPEAELVKSVKGERVEDKESVAVEK